MSKEPFDFNTLVEAEPPATKRSERHSVGALTLLWIGRITLALMVFPLISWTMTGCERDVAVEAFFQGDFGAIAEAMGFMVGSALVPFLGVVLIWWARKRGVTTGSIALKYGVVLTITHFFVPLLPSWHGLLYDSAKDSAQRAVRDESTAIGAPEGLLGARWLMTMADVQSIRPNAQAGLQANELVEFVAMFGRQVAVAYVFKDDLLLMIYVTFPAPSSKEAYDLARVEIVEEYGEMPEPVRKDGRLASTKHVGRVAISHDLYEQDGMLVQQLLVYRTR